MGTSLGPSEGSHQPDRPLTFQVARDEARHNGARRFVAGASPSRCEQLGDSVRSSAGIVTIPGLAAWMEAGLCPPISMTPCSRLRTALIHLGISY